MEIDQHKLMYHPERVAEWKEKGDCYPVYVEIGSTDRCNHNCTFCALDWVGNKGNDIDTGILKWNLEDMAEHGVKSVMFAGEGEPLLHKDIGSLVTYAHEVGLDVSMTTTGSLLSQRKAEEILPNLTWIRFSVDAGTPETYSKVHITKLQEFERTIGNIERAVNIKKRKGLNLTIGAQFLMIPTNVHEVIEFTTLMRKIGVDNVQIKPYSQHPLSNKKFIVDYSRDHIPFTMETLESLKSEKFKIFYREETMKRLSEEVPYKNCYGLPFFALISARGEVLPCNLFYNDKEHSYGNINETSFSRIWKGPKRHEVLDSFGGVEACREGCRLDVINRYLHRIKNPEAHDNFP